MKQILVILTLIVGSVSAGFLVDRYLCSHNECPCVPGDCCDVND